MGSFGLLSPARGSINRRMALIELSTGAVFSSESVLQVAAIDAAKLKDAGFTIAEE